MTGNILRSFPTNWSSKLLFLYVISAWNAPSNEYKQAFIVLGFIEIALVFSEKSFFEFQSIEH